MKTLIALIIFLCSLPAYTACKCTCEPTDFRLCASLYDIDHPCGSLCSSSATPGTIMITACPVTQVINQLGIKVWVSGCNQ